ncbi:MAG: hypothetical protein NC177_07675 [Ruminococcus flavefaciens]|nr:hypothetical protein [Ruminococcus flavefaciens]
MRLVDAEKLFFTSRANGMKVAETFDEPLVRVGFAMGVEHMGRIIAIAPTADAVLVKHGHWEKAYIGADLEGGLCIGDTEHSGYLCSVCRHFTYPYLNGQLEMKYCFNCGAKMDGGG